MSRFRALNERTQLSRHSDGRAILLGLLAACRVQGDETDPQITLFLGEFTDGVWTGSRPHHEHDKTIQALALCCRVHVLYCWVERAVPAVLQVCRREAANLWGTWITARAKVGNRQALGFR